MPDRPKSSRTSGSCLGLPHDLLWRLEWLTLETPLSCLKPAITVISVAVASTFVAAAHPPGDLTRGLEVDVLVGRRRATRWSLDHPDDASNDLSSTIALDIGMVSARLARVPESVPVL
jgi:hypothetical protein